VVAVVVWSTAVASAQQMPSPPPPQPKTFLERSFSFYASYHDNFINQLIHIICVWPIFWTAVLFLQYSSDLPEPITEALKPILPIGHSTNWSLPFLLFYFFFYLLVELPGVIGPLCALFVYLTSLTTIHVKETYADSAPWKIALVVHIVAWVAQFYGHGVHEGRSPALLDNLFGAIVMAPLFVVMEVAFFCGYKPKFRARVGEIVRHNLQLFKAASPAGAGKKKK
jgi:2-hydroxy fatty acid dioxygenase